MLIRVTTRVSNTDFSINREPVNLKIVGFNCLKHRLTQHLSISCVIFSTAVLTRHQTQVSHSSKFLGEELVYVRCNDDTSDTFAAVCDRPCANGGTCVKPNRCRCPHSYRPPFCES